MTRFLRYFFLGFIVAAIGYSIGLSALGIVIGLCLGFIIISIVEWRVI